LRSCGLRCANRRSGAASEPAFELLDSLRRRLELVAQGGRLARVGEVEKDEDRQADERGEACVCAGRREEVGDRKSEGDGHFRLA
jgi:hypothetical protein